MDTLRALKNDCIIKAIKLRGKPSRMTAADLEAHISKLQSMIGEGKGQSEKEWQSFISSSFRLIEATRTLVTSLDEMKEGIYLVTESEKPKASVGGKVCGNTFHQHYSWQDRKDIN